MNYPIFWTQEARVSFNKNLDYLEKDWNNKVMNQFLDNVEDTLKRISDNPLIFPAYKSYSNIRKAIINKRILLIYRITEDSRIELLTFWNTYQNPEKLKL